MLSYYRGYTSDFKHINPCKTGVIEKLFTTIYHATHRLKNGLTPMCIHT